MQIQDSFLEPEVRDGFYVPSVVKQAWAAEMKVLQEIDKICKKHDIPYFADWGTLLGAVRHKGFVPWDDDLDITMKRADYERFLQVAESEMPEGFALFTYDRHPDFWSFMARVVAKNRICFEKEHMSNFYGFPYIVGIDIFVLDYASNDEEKNQERNILARYVIEVADNIAEEKLTGKAAMEALDKIENLFRVSILNRENVQQLRVQLYQIAEKIFAMFSEKESKYLTRMMPHELYNSVKLRFPKEYYDKQIWLPFENILLPVPSGYDEMLRQRYGDYMKLVRTGGKHDYPFFETQKKQLQAVLDFEMPGYRYKCIAERNQVRGREKSLKGILAQKYEDMVSYLQEMRKRDAAEVSILQECQQLAIEMGTLIETCKGEGHPTVSILETYCEMIFRLSENYTSELVDELEAVVFALKKSIRKEILDRKEAVFLPYKASQWAYIESVWQAAMQDENCDVYVIPIPYFYKEYDGELRDMQYEAEQFPKEVSVVRYDEFDFELHYPELIFTQNPYDAYDEVISVHRFFYSENLLNFTEQLTYIPPFVVEEFKKDNYREYHNMQHYCTMPGVVNADKVIVQSENMKELYVEKLTEFAGADTRRIWEEKIVGLGSPVMDVATSLEAKWADIPTEWLARIEKSDGNRRKVILYYTNLSSFMQYKERMLVKMQKVFDVFYEQKENVVMIWKPHALIKTTLEQSDTKLYQKYLALQDKFMAKEIGILDELEDDELTVAVCDAYFGDASSIAQMCRTSGKPVMLQDVDVEG